MDMVRFNGKGLRKIRRMSMEKSPSRNGRGSFSQEEGGGGGAGAGAGGGGHSFSLFCQAGNEALRDEWVDAIKRAMLREHKFKLVLLGESGVGRTPDYDLMHGAWCLMPDA